MSIPVLKMKNISKNFGGVKALKGIDFELEKGEIHALLGENGAGKSTLIKILGGIHKPDTGEIIIDGKQVAIDNVQDAQKNGIAIIHQEIVMVPELTVAENIFLGREPLNSRKLLDKRKMKELATKAMAELELDIDVETKVGTLTIAQQQLIEIVKAVSFDIDILVMDEPTSSLSSSDIRLLFIIMERLLNKGISIIYISHRFEEIFEISDRITVIRDGEYIDTVETSATNKNKLVSLMVGRNIENLYTRTAGNIRDYEILKVENFSKNGVFEDVSFNVHAGEIVGFSGLVGSKRSDVMEAIFGARKFDSGKIYLNGTEIKINSTADAIRHGIGLVPEDRKKQGLLLEQSVVFNLSLANLSNLLDKNLIVNQKKCLDVSNEYSNMLRIKATSSETIVSTLSGGNQQKVVIAKWLSTNPKVLILDEPTRGVDVGARSEIYSIINKLSEAGIGIIMISSDLPEILNMVDRTYVMREGKLVGEVQKNEMTQENIMHYATGGGENING